MSELPSRENIQKVLKTVFDPEIPVDIYELGLIYDVSINGNDVHVSMTLTSPNCPAAQSLPAEVKKKVSTVKGVESVQVEIVWDPPWGMEMMSEVAKLQLGYL